MRHNVCFLILINFLFGFIQPASHAQQHIYDKGVSSELADMRKHDIEDLSYTLHFSIPEKKTEPVQGFVIIRLNLNNDKELILDFKENESKLKAIVMNGKETMFTFKNEHIILPKGVVKKGRNEIKIDFIAGDQSLNRNDEFLYTLLVPDRTRTLFPCFEQPSLKAKFTLSLEIPAEWKAVSNTHIINKTVKGNRQSLHFAQTEPLSTYLFSFVAGKLERKEYDEGTRKIAAYYRETDPMKVSQLDTIFKQVVSSLQWLEEYTGIPYPFSKYDLIILPGFQYGGMEHVGATLYNDIKLFLNSNPTPDEELARTQIIAHETAHMWFGDLVTMDWFDDAWTKEVFANYFAAHISEPLFPDINHNLNWLKTCTALALAEDRTPGTTPIRQQLDNLQDAGLTYGQIAYNKAPIMLDKLVELMGKDNFRKGIQEYLHTYAYGNATWNDLIHILDSHTEQDLTGFSNVWVNQKGMPTVTLTTEGKQLIVSQYDPYKRGLYWPQHFNVTVCGENTDTTITINLDSDRLVLQLPFTPTHILPNTDGRGYGLLIPDGKSMKWLLQHWQKITNETTRQALLMLLNENYQAKHISSETWTDALINGLRHESNPLIASAITSYLYSPLHELPKDKQTQIEKELYAISNSHTLASCRTQLLRLLITEANSNDMTQQLMEIWKQQSSPLLSEKDYTTLAYELAVRLPLQSHDILATQRCRITDPDRLRQFDFISRATVSDTIKLDCLFNTLLQADNRRIEPWAASALTYLNHPARGNYAVKYIRPALEAVIDIQHTGDIFFPRIWAGALLGRHTSSAAYQEVQAFFNAHPDYPQLLKNKILQAAYPLYRKNEIISHIP